MRFSFQYIDFPNSKTLTDKSRLIGRLTHPCVALLIAAAICMLGSGFMQNDSYFMPFMAVCIAVFILSWILLAKYRQKRFAELKEEYRKMMESH